MGKREAQGSPNFGGRCGVFSAQNPAPLVIVNYPDHDESSHMDVSSSSFSMSEHDHETIFCEDEPPPLPLEEKRRYPWKAPPLNVWFFLLRERSGGCDPELRCKFVEHTPGRRTIAQLVESMRKSKQRNLTPATATRLQTQISSVETTLLKFPTNPFSRDPLLKFPTNPFGRDPLLKFPTNPFSRDPLLKFPTKPILGRDPLLKFPSPILSVETHS